MNKPVGPKGGSDPLKSFPVTTLEEDEAQDAVDEEIHRDENVSIRVTQQPGYLCHIEATAAIRMPARTLFKQVITHPDNAAVFRHMDRCSYRRVLEDDRRGRRRVHVAHEASWRFLLFHGTFTTKLFVEEDDNELTMNFQLDPSGGGVMRKFHGRWRIRPHPKDPQHASLSTLDQELALGIYMPPPFDRILKRISCNQVKNIFADVQKEAAKVASGKPTLCPWEEVKDKQIGVEADADTAAAAAEAAAANALFGLSLQDTQPAGQAAGEVEADSGAEAEPAAGLAEAAAGPAAGPAGAAEAHVELAAPAGSSKSATGDLLPEAVAQLAGVMLPAK